MRYTTDYVSAKVHNFTDLNGDVVGWTKKAGKGAGNVAFVAFENAGHMVSKRRGMYGSPAPVGASR